MAVPVKHVAAHVPPRPTRLLQQPRTPLPGAGQAQLCCCPLPALCADDVVIQFARSSGAGGQNVNKVNTKVDMRFNLAAAAWLDEEVREAVLRMVSRDAHFFVWLGEMDKRKGA